MLHSLSENIADFLLSKDCFQKENYDIYVYGTELILSTVLGVLIIFLLSAVMNCLVQGLLFYLTFSILRSYTGGLHCMTYLRCNLTFVAVFLMCIFSDIFIKSFQYRTAVLICMTSISLIIIFLLAPIEHKNKPIEYKDRKKFKMLSLIVFGINLGVFCLLDLVFEYKADIIIITDFFVALMMIIGLYNNKYSKNKEELL